MASIGDYFNFQNGYAFKSSDFTENGQYRIVRIKELKDGAIKFFADTARINVPDDFDANKYIIQKGDVLFALTGDPVNKPNPLSWVGRVSYYNHSEPALLNQRVCKAIPKGNVPSEFLYYFFRQTGEFYNLASKATGSASQANISTKTIEQHEIEIPDSETMDKIISMLSDIDKKIEVNNQINRNLLEQAKSIFTENFGKSNPNGLLSNIVKENDKSKIKVGDVKGVTGEYPFYTSGSSILEYDTYLVDGRNIYLNTGGNADVKFYIGKAAYSTDTWSIYADEYTDYLFILLNNNIQEINDVYFEGSALKHLQKKNLLNKEIYIPGDTEIKKFNELVCLLFDIINTNISENKKLGHLRDSLLPKLMSGELDVSDLNI